MNRIPLTLDLPQDPLTSEVIQKYVSPLFSRERKRSEIYLANHSLGRPLDKMAEDVQLALDAWYQEMDGAWGLWFDLLTRFRELTARSIGLTRADCVIPKSSAGQGLRAVLNAFPGDRPLRVIATSGEFDSLDVILKSYIRHGRIHVTWINPTSNEGQVPRYELDAILNALTTGVDLVVVPVVFFTTGQRLMGAERLVAAAHAVGARVMLDVYHAQGVFPLHMEADGFDFMIGGSYKYVRGGPGAGWLAIHPNIVHQLTTLDTGWFAQREPFAFRRQASVDLAEDGNRWMESTMPILPYVQALAGLELLDEVGVDRIRRFTLDRLDAWRSAMRQNGLDVFAPSEPEAWGAYGLWPREDFAQVVPQLKSAGVNVDARSGFIRFGPDLLTTDEELERTAEICRRVAH
jgi:kynureninase